MISAHALSLGRPEGGGGGRSKSRGCVDLEIHIWPKCGGQKSQKFCSRPLWMVPFLQSTMCFGQVRTPIFFIMHSKQFWWILGSIELRQLLAIFTICNENFAERGRHLTQTHCKSVSSKFYFGPYINDVSQIFGYQIHATSFLNHNVANPPPPLCLTLFMYGPF